MNTTTQNRPLEIARRMVELGQTEDACKAYTLALDQMTREDQTQKCEAALYLFQNGGDYKISYTVFRDLYNQGFAQQELLSLMSNAFYAPNEKLLRTRYEKNCKLLSKYPYLFRKDFLDFDDLPILFFPYDDNGYVPLDRRTARFGDYINFNDTRITRNFFRDLDQPILASDVYSMYELSYLNDNVRKSEYVAKENHIYLHYTDWPTLCAYLQVLNFRKLLEDKKFVFLVEDQIDQYPIDFKERFGIDYTQFPVKPLQIKEINRLIWHTQLSTHNGGDFFNEIFDNHPNLITFTSIMMDNIEKSVVDVRNYLAGGHGLSLSSPADGDREKVDRLVQQLRLIPNPSDKDILVFAFLWIADLRPLDPASRIAPAVFLQPHFPNIKYGVAHREGKAVLVSEEYDKIQKSHIFKEFPYIKTFTPIRRPSTSYASTVKFMREWRPENKEDDKIHVVSDVVSERVLNRSFMIDPQNRLFRDSVLVRFEDGKLDPKATFTSLCAFLDLPYTESMTYCSMAGERDPLEFDTNVRGFDPATVYRTYDDYAGKPERYFLEYFMRDIYEYCGYDFHYYDGAPMDMEKVEELVDHFDVQDRYMRETWGVYFRTIVEKGRQTDPQFKKYDGLTDDEVVEKMLDDKAEMTHKQRLHIAEVLLQGLRFVNKNGQRLKMMPKLELDPTLLERPLYH